MNISISRENLFTLLSGMSLADRRWFAKTLTEQVERDEADAEKKWKKLMGRTPSWEDEYKEAYDHVFASFSKDWGGDGDAMEIAESLRNEHSEGRAVETW